MTSNETPAPGTDGSARDGKRMVYIDEAAREANLEGVEERMKGVAGTVVVAPEGTPLAAGEDPPRRFVAKEPSVSRFERRKAARAELRNASRGE